eukprot:CAMPEP_0170546622 /NCGR_PEP_ID=MMETSP0211-20121228/4990_1 /TAXON_ID=311385 /ORGANISM="Pseudokeronopsis sp., Strain OXSARD2" /LENGTH=102 /DNA_ID=CAMNT_0010851189 /DNA_START=1 /DNA_END=309 /DNA_ORIENTATION=-
MAVNKQNYSSTNVNASPLELLKEDDQHYVKGKMSEAMKADGRKDRKGKTILRGSKIHHITFKDEIPMDEKEDDSEDEGKQNGEQEEEGKKTPESDEHIANIG